jgi:hypothetical protein
MNDQIKEYVNKCFDELKENAGNQIDEIIAARPEKINPEVIFQAILKQAIYERRNDLLYSDVIDRFLCL